MNRRHKSKPEHDSMVLDESEDPIERARAIRLLGIDGRFEHEMAFEQLVVHDHPEIRSTALQTLLSWSREAYLPVGIRMALTDSAPAARSNSVFGLALFVDRNESARELVCRALYQVVAKDEDCRQMAYRTLIGLLGQNRSRRLFTETFDPERDIDWDLLAPYAEPPAGLH